MPQDKAHQARPSGKPAKKRSHSQPPEAAPMTPEEYERIVAKVMHAPQTPTQRAKKQAAKVRQTTRKKQATKSSKDK